MVHVIILEGPDGGGKSSLAVYLSEQLGVDLSDESKLPVQTRNLPAFRSRDAVRKRTYQAMMREAVAKRDPLIYDRLFWSELIYSEVHGRECAFNYAEQRMIARFMLALEVPLVFCLPSFNTVKKGILNFEQMDGVARNITDIYAKYALMAKMMHGARRDQSVRVSLTSAKNLSSSRVGKELSLPRCIVYDYENPRHQKKVVGICQRYLERREKRSVSWS